MKTLTHAIGFIKLTVLLEWQYGIEWEGNWQ
jgi:hypothetical protein